VATDEKGNLRDAYSVLASFGADFSAGTSGNVGTPSGNPSAPANVTNSPSGQAQAQASGGLAQYFATGAAAQILARTGGAAVVATGEAAKASAQSASLSGELAVRQLIAEKTPSVTKITGWLLPEGNLDQVHFDALQAWLNQQPEPFLHDQDYPPGAFAMGRSEDPKFDFEAIRKRALSDPKLGIP
jgi:hypothetical protein